jgi:hypothetical protein
MWYTILITLLIDIGGLVLVYALLRDRVRRATTADSQIEQIRDEVSRLLVELNQTTDRNIGLLEDKIASLNGELAAADKKIGLLRREIEKHDVGTQIYSRLAEGRARTAPSAPVAAPSPVTAPAAPAAPPPAAVPLAVELSEPQAATDGRERPADLQSRVLMLHRAGFAATLIAGRVGIPLGEVELIISLEQRKGQA